MYILSGAQTFLKTFLNTLMQSFPSFRTHWTSRAKRVYVSHVAFRRSLKSVFLKTTCRNKKTEEQTLTQVGIVHSLAETYVYAIHKNVYTIHTKTVSKLNLRTTSWRAVMHSANLSEQTEVQDANCDESYVNFAFTNRRFAWWHHLTTTTRILQ